VPADLLLIVAVVTRLLRDGIGTPPSWRHRVCRLVPVPPIRRLAPAEDSSATQVARVPEDGDYRRPVEPMTVNDRLRVHGRLACWILHCMMCCKRGGLWSAHYPESFTCPQRENAGAIAGDPQRCAKRPRNRPR
jgi:hypothetical protein